MFRFFILLSSILISLQAFGQCEPDTLVPLDRVAVYPLPFGVIPIEDGGTGIVDTAFIDQPFEMTFTIAFPDTFLDPATQSLTIGDSVLINPDSLRVIFNDEEVDGLPDGLQLIVNPEGWIKPSGSGPVGCINLTGTPSSDVVPGDYLLFFGINACIQNPALTGCINIELPSVFTNILGEYRLTVSDMTSSIPEVLNKQKSIQVNPNPFDSNVTISFDSNDLTGNYQLSVLNLSGQRVLTQSVQMTGNVQRLFIDASTWESGLYLFSLNGKEGQFNGKLVKN
jgi:hypothetical protein